MSSALVKIYNTLSGKLEGFRPASGNKVSMYVCGLTPYDSMHIGHARTFCAFDMARRWLLGKGCKVFFVQNVTDVDDKIIRRAKEIGEEPLALSSKFDAQSREEMGGLGIMPADSYPKVSENIGGIVEMIGELVGKKAAYVTESGVYFEVAKFKNYGKLSKQDMGQINAGERIEVDERKKNPADFALWKVSAEKPNWESPWGRGRPGWHIECSAMSTGLIGGTIDIHGGARDLVFPHHENEIAQSEAALGRRFARVWMHSGFLTVGGEKMSKSLGNFVTAERALAEHGADSLRMFFALSHYRSPVDFTKGALESAAANVERVLLCASELRKIKNAQGTAGVGGAESAVRAKKKAVGKKKAGVEKFRKWFSECMDNDFDTPGAAAVMFELVRECNAAIGKGGLDAGEASERLEILEWMLGIFGVSLDAKKTEVGGVGLPDEEIERMLHERGEARGRGEFKKSDAIRASLERDGVIVEDMAGGARWRRKGETEYHQL